MEYRRFFRYSNTNVRNDRPGWEYLFGVESAKSHVEDMRESSMSDGKHFAIITFSTTTAVVCMNTRCGGKTAGHRLGWHYFRVRKLGRVRVYEIYNSLTPLEHATTLWQPNGHLPRASIHLWPIQFACWRVINNACRHFVPEENGEFRLAGWVFPSNIWSNPRNIFENNSRSEIKHSSQQSYA